MRSRFETPDEILGADADHRSLPPEDFRHYERLARVERAALIGELLADAILWAFRLPNRVVAALRAQAAGMQALRQARRHAPVAR